MDLKRRVLRALTGVEDDPAPPPVDVALVSGIDDPPTYVVFVALCGVAGLHCSSDEKMVWTVHIRFGDLQFSIADWKRGSWSIRGVEGSSGHRRGALKLRRKVTAAARLVEPHLEDAFARMVESGGFYVENSYHRVRPLYEHHRGRVVELDVERRRITDSWKQGDASANDTTPGGSPGAANLERLSQILTTHANDLGPWSRRLAYAAAPMVVFFFSYTEIILDILYAFQRDRGGRLHRVPAPVVGGAFQAGAPGFA